MKESQVNFIDKNGNVTPNEIYYDPEEIWSRVPKRKLRRSSESNKVECKCNKYNHYKIVKKFVSFSAPQAVRGSPAVRRASSEAELLKMSKLSICDGSPKPRSSQSAETKQETKKTKIDQLQRKKVKPKKKLRLE